LGGKKNKRNASNTELLCNKSEVEEDSFFSTSAEASVGEEE